MAVVAPPGTAARSLALNKLYGLPAPAAKKPPAETPWERALRLRSEALNKSLGLPNAAADPGATPTAPPAAPPTAQRIAVPGYDPDFKSLIAGDPTLLSNEADLTDLSGQIDPAKNSAIRRAIIAAGLDPGVRNDAVDQATVDAALGNQNSTAKTIQEEALHRGTDLEAILSARGILDSGGLTGGHQRIQQNYERTQSAAVGNLLDQITGYEGDAAAKKAQITAQHAALREAAALRVQQDPRFQPVGATDAVLDPGSGLYLTPDGRWYNADGTRAADPSAASTAAATSSQNPPPVTPPTVWPTSGGRFARDSLNELGLY